VGEGYSKIVEIGEINGTQVCNRLRPADFELVEEARVGGNSNEEEKGKKGGDKSEGRSGMELAEGEDGLEYREIAGKEEIDEEDLRGRKKEGNDGEGRAGIIGSKQSEAKQAARKEEEDVRLEAIEETRLREEEDVRLKAIEEARLREEEDVRLKDIDEARLKEEEDVRLKTIEEARLREEEDVRLKAIEEARLREEEDVRLKDIDESRLKEEEDVRLKTMKRRMELIHLRLAICREGDAWVVLEERAVLVEDLHLAGLIEDLMEDDEALGFLNREGTEKQKREQRERGQIREELVGSNKLTGRSLLRPIYMEQARLREKEDVRLKATEEARLREEEDVRLKVIEEARLWEEKEVRLKAIEETRLRE
jgi:trichohyalin